MRSRGVTTGVGVVGRGRARQAQNGCDVAYCFGDFGRREIRVDGRGDFQERGFKRGSLSEASA
jgi:hypothetical protein